MPKGENYRRMGCIKRNVICGCGWSCTSAPDRIFKIISLHSKKCDFIDINSFKNLPTSSLHDNRLHEDTPKNTNIEAICFKNGEISSINLKKNNMIGQVISKLK